MYTNIGDAIGMLQERQASGLAERVEGWWVERGRSRPPLPQTLGRYAFWARQVATYRFEDALFELMARSIGCDPFWMEFTSDLFCTASEFKRSFGSPRILLSETARGGKKMCKPSLIDPTRSEGVPMNELVTKSGASLVELHHVLHRRMTDAQRVECSDWYQRILCNDWSAHPHRTSISRYSALLSTAVAHGIFFENFDDCSGDVNMTRFVQCFVEPALSTLRAVFGVEPIIVCVPWHDDLALYPADARSVFLD